MDLLSLILAIALAAGAPDATTTNSSPDNGTTGQQVPPPSDNEVRAHIIDLG